jgi:hypothetical protein
VGLKKDMIELYGIFHMQVFLKKKKVNIEGLVFNGKKDFMIDILAS